MQSVRNLDPGIYHDPVNMYMGKLVPSYRSLCLKLIVIFEGIKTER